MLKWIYLQTFKKVSPPNNSDNHIFSFHLYATFYSSKISEQRINNIIFTVFTMKICYICPLQGSLCSPQWVWSFLSLTWQEGSLCLWKTAQQSLVRDSYQWFLELVGFYAANEERLTHTERPHQHLEGTFELAAQSWRTLSCFNTLKIHCKTNKQTGKTKLNK